MHASELAEPLGPISPHELLAHYARQIPQHKLVREPSTTAPEPNLPSPLLAPRNRARRRRAVPAWLVSLVVHFAAISVLAMFSVVPLVLARSRTIEVAQLAEPPRIETLEDISVSSPTSNRAPSSSPVGDLLISPRPVEIEQLQLTTVDVSLADWDTPSQRGSGGFGGGSTQTLLDTPISSGQTAHFFGVQARGGKFVFIVDNLRSMRDGKFTEAKTELASAIHRLSADQSFYVIFFSGTTCCMSFSPYVVPEPSPVVATPQNIARFEDWMGTIATLPDTEPTEALRIAVEMAPDAIFLLSDGEFSDRSRTLRYLTAHNRELDKSSSSSSSSRFSPKVIIHTIAFWDNVGEKTMRLIARLTAAIFASSHRRAA